MVMMAVVVIVRLPLTPPAHPRSSHNKKMEEVRRSGCLARRPTARERHFPTQDTHQVASGRPLLITRDPSAKKDHRHRCVVWSGGGAGGLLTQQKFASWRIPASPRLTEGRRSSGGDSGV